MHYYYLQVPRLATSRGHVIIRDRTLSNRFLLFLFYQKNALSTLEKIMRKLYALGILFLFCSVSPAFAREARLVRYPHYHDGRIVFSYLGDVWTADENGQNVQRLTVNRARDVYPRFSPDGKWIAFSSERNGNLDVFIIPSEGGAAKQLTFHSADDTVLGWKPDSRAVLFSSNRGEDFTTQLYLVNI